MNTIEKLDKLECCGCSSCVQKCPQHAIEMKENEEGFFYPEIDKEKCINCGLCIKVCPQLKEIKRENERYPKAYAIYNKNKEELMQSSSGGVFSAIANYVLENNGVVFGATYDENLKVKHIKVENKENLIKLKKSKYMQSEINNTYIEVEKLLKEGIYVMFSGTPCQVSGLKTFLLKEYDNLITCDLVCHGVPSTKAFLKYLKALEGKNKKVISYDFRTKDKPEFEKLAKVEFSNNTKKYLKMGTDCFYNNFLAGNLFRESCYKCKYANMKRVGDITIGDFIGVKEVQPQVYNRDGISIVIINNKTGEKLLNILQEKLTIQATTIEKIKKYNSNLSNPTVRPKVRDQIYIDIEGKKFIKDLKKNMSKKLMIKSLVPIKLKLLLKRIRGGTL